jgi:4-amino-4-deoxy-L-arabinose transferase-like glycosyltransferase
MGENLLNGKGYSFFYYDNHGDTLAHRYDESIEPLPSAYMPPGYVGFLIPFLLVPGETIGTILLLIVQALLGVLALYLLYCLGVTFFSRRTALIGVAIAAVLPEFVYASVSFTPTVLFHVLVLLLLLMLNSRFQGESPAWKWSDVGIGLTMLAIVSIRGEFGLFILFYLVLILYRRRVWHAATIVIVLIAGILPWTIRNYVTFGEVVPLTTSFGLNFFRGHNQWGIGSWGEETVIDSAAVAEQGENLEIWMNREYSSRAIDFIGQQPITELERIPVKLFYFWAFDPDDKRSSLLLYILPSILLLLAGIIGLVRTWSWKRYHLFYLFFIYSTMIILLFFPLPRYGTMTRMLWIPFVAEGIAFVASRFAGSNERSADIPVRQSD